MKYFSAFTGVGGLDMGLPKEWKCVGMSEVDKHANMVLKYRFPEVVNYGDIEKIDYAKLPDFDILVGGSPCQDVSIAGKRKGITGSRSRLFFTYIAILQNKRPDYFIFENVKGLLSSNEGRDFAEMLNCFSKAGYNLWWQVLDATSFGIPQHRERVFILGAAGGRSFARLFFDNGSGKKNTELQGQEANIITRRYRASQATGSYIVENQFNAQIETVYPSRRQNYRVYGTEGIAPTLHRKTGGGQVTKIAIPVADISHLKARQQGRRIKELNEPSFTLQSMQRQGVYNGMKIRYLTPLECERLMGWPDEWTKYGIDGKGDVIELTDNARYSLIGNGVVPQVVSNIVSMLPHSTERVNE